MKNSYIRKENNIYRLNKRKLILSIFILSIVTFSIITIGKLILYKNKATYSSNPAKKTEPRKAIILPVEPNNDGIENKVPVQNSENNSSNFSPYTQDGKRVAYLTFDDGPSAKVTPKILNILDAYNIKATFFIVGEMALANKSILIREKSDGQVIANHTFSHDYNNIYSTPDNFLKDIVKDDITIKSIIGSYDDKLIRFPGGSFGAKLASFRQAVLNRGYHYIDWNALNGDTLAKTVPADKLLNNFNQTSKGKDHLVILMHDLSTKETTAKVLPKIIDTLKSEGYIFKTLQ